MKHIKNSLVVLRACSLSSGSQRFLFRRLHRDNQERRPRSSRRRKMSQS
jgi:hypothetical protein